MINTEMPLDDSKTNHAENIRFIVSYCLRLTGEIYLIFLMIDRP